MWLGCECCGAVVTGCEADYGGGEDQRERERCTCISVCVGGGYSDIAGSVTRRQHGCGGLEELAGETVSVADLMHTLSSVEGQPVEIEVTFNCAMLSRMS